MFSLTGLVIALLIYHSAHGEPGPQIDGGIAAEKEEFPYQVSLKQSRTGVHFCGGAIIGETCIITAGHCIYKKNITDILIDTGSIDVLHPLKMYLADELILHPNYNHTTQINDIGLIKLSQKIDYDNKNIKSIDILENDNFDKVDLVVSGWGQVSSRSQKLQKMIVQTVPMDMCKTVNEYVSNKTNICAMRSLGVGVCDGDSGGPLTYKKKLVGIVSIGRCGNGNPDVYTKVNNYKSWIDTYNAGNNQQLSILLGLFTMYLCIYPFFVDMHILLHVSMIINFADE